MMTAPAARSFSTTWASYGGIQPRRIFEPAVVASPRVTSTSLSAIGTPPSGPSGIPAARRRSSSAAWARAPAPSTSR
jgi:hypothetical protein